LFAFSDTDASGGALIAGEGLENINGEGLSGPLIDDASGVEFGSAYYDCPEPSTCSFSIGNQVSIGDGAGVFTTEELNFLLGEGAALLNGGDDNDTGKAGAFGTIEAGFDYQVGSNFVIGLNAAFNLASTSIENSAATAGVVDFNGFADGFGSQDVEGTTTGALDTELELGNSWSIGGRAGFLASDSILLFVSGGYVSTKAELSASYNMESDNYLFTDIERIGEADAGFGARAGVSSSDDEWLNGYYLGGGVETLLTENVSFKMEYRFSDLGSIETSKGYSYEEDPDGDAYGIALAGVEAEANPIVHAIRATVNWRF
jgi:outer membrane immunogenic protein